MTSSTKNILAEFPEMRCPPIDTSINLGKLASICPALNQFLEGGLPYGSLVEWGLPYGKGGREILLRFLANATTLTPPLCCLWVIAKQDLTLYPPAWAARGVDLKHLRIAHSTSPLQELRPVFLSPVFNMIIIDSPKSLSKEESAFLQRQARSQQKIIMIVRNRPLDPKQGNIWARLRINAWQERTQDRYCIQVIRGLSPRQVSLKLEEQACPN